MKKIVVEMKGEERKMAIVPDNCKHPNLLVTCNAYNTSNPECDCRWCVFNKEYNKAKSV